MMKKKTFFILWKGDNRPLTTIKDMEKMQKSNDPGSLKNILGSLEKGGLWWIGGYDQVKGYCILHTAHYTCHQSAGSKTKSAKCKILHFAPCTLDLTW